MDRPSCGHVSGADASGVDSGRISGTDDDLVYRARRTPRIAVAVAIVVAVAHVVVGVLLRISDTGVDFRLSDTFGLPLIGVVLAGLILLLTRPRLRVGSVGVAIRNIGEERFFSWDDVVGIYFPAKGHWARLELPGDDYVPVLAIQVWDRERAVAAMEGFRESHERYGR